ncbi:hypothetical protein IHE44_0003744 [Lamprotornis superbus]|uniref:Teneurin N-terminal domain-containing protein n=1 Tax=Lamprotornis superbus TaxID=245042 RepID=A0A835NR72_9PASS|nr:hypothetical protein IHE44_0003744 [Lamprotornis superbus]
MEDLNGKWHRMCEQRRLDRVRASRAERGASRGHLSLGMATWEEEEVLPWGRILPGSAQAGEGKVVPESFAYVVTEWLAGALVRWGELSLGKPSVQWETIQLCALAATPGTWSSSCSSSQALQADSQPGCAKGRLLQGFDQAGWTGRGAGMCSDITHAQEQWGPLGLSIGVIAGNWNETGQLSDETLFGKSEGAPPPHAHGLSSHIHPSGSCSSQSPSLFVQNQLLKSNGNCTKLYKGMIEEWLFWQHRAWLRIMDIKDRRHRSLTRGRCGKQCRYTSSSLDSEDCRVPTQKSYSSSETLKAYDHDTRMHYGNRVSDLVHRESDEFPRQARTCEL